MAVGTGLVLETSARPAPLHKRAFSCWGNVEATIADCDFLDIEKLPQGLRNLPNTSRLGKKSEGRKTRLTFLTSLLAFFPFSDGGSILS
jgi:hypothetical protein